jgi:hypothetical protein
MQLLTAIEQNAIQVTVFYSHFNPRNLAGCLSLGVCCPVILGIVILRGDFSLGVCGFVEE